MRTFLAFLFISISIFGFSQSFGEIGTTWTYSMHDGWASYISEPSQIIVVKDTIVKGENCIKIRATSLGLCDFMPTVPVVLEKDSAIYFYTSERDSFIMFIDFKLKAGDTYAINWINKHDQGKQVVRVDSVSFVTINGFRLKKQHISLNNNLRSSNVERIGNFIDFFFWRINEGWCEDYGKSGLRCVDSPTIGHYSTGIVPSCDYTNVGIEEETELMRITVYPNPVSVVLNIELQEQNLPLDFKLYSLSGKAVLEQTLTQFKSELDLENLPSGMYFYELVEEGKRISQGKIVKQ